MLIEDEGRNYTAAEYEQWLTETGSRQPRRVPLNVPGTKGLITSGLPVRGTPPGA
jgi:3-hydroxy-5-methyl-1-naphthoate 3-O-methyltransferase